MIVPHNIKIFFWILNKGILYIKDHLIRKGDWLTRLLKLERAAYILEMEDALSQDRVYANVKKPSFDPTSNNPPWTDIAWKIASCPLT
ncbi:hypothetical protein OPV22_033102 [Ensete ventricosum]|uniref:Uncharacterized protein n=1 Tax=Ensete ventricosum TaxID=4639 RepID=A0AAV8P304_ENSVE|nr:hypothetical protein OPV22_033102 [Ensete ventricosum]